MTKKELAAATKADQYSALLARQGLTMSFVGREFRKLVNEAVMSRNWTPVLAYIEKMGGV